MQDEYDKWLEHHATFNPSELQKQKIAEDTGMVPMYLSQLDNFFLEKHDMLTAIQDCKAWLGLACSKALNSFFVGCSDEDPRIISAKFLLAGAVPELDEKHWDHRYFYIEAGSSHAVCGVAREVLAIILREKLKNQADEYFLSDSYVQKCLQCTNPTVKGFEAEQIAISAINKNGFNLCRGNYASVVSSTFKTSKTAVLTSDACCHYIPTPFNYKFVDSLVRAQTVKKGATTAESANIYAIQYTLQSYSDHRESLGFFDKEFEPWQRDIKVFARKKSIHWHFVWILTAKEAALQRRKSGTNGQRVQHSKNNVWYTEWFYSFEEVFRKLRI